MLELAYRGPAIDRADEVLSAPALALVEELQGRFGARRDELLQARSERHRELARAGRADFLPQTREVREAAWQVAPAPADLRDRRVEITGPTERKMTINALNSGAQVWLADLEDANTPHWRNVVAGQVNLHDAVRRTITFRSPEGREYALEGETHPTIVMRPRGWHLPERHLLAAGVPVVAALVDVGLHLFHNARELLARGSGPYLYLPKLESHLEARLWDEVLAAAEQHLGLPSGAVRTTVLIETFPAALEMDEILFELRGRASGLNAGRWDYLFSIIKCFREAGPGFVLPDRNAVTMTAPFMHAYAELLVQTCHRRGAHAIGGMAAFIPNRRDPAVTERALAKVREDKAREAGAGFDGSWVAHPDLVPVCRAAFDAVLGERPHQLDRTRPEVHVAAQDLLELEATPGQATREGLRGNVEVALRYLEAWLGGTGAVSIHDLMEDAATAEISRSQIWQWVRQGVALAGEGPLGREDVERTLADVVAALRRDAGEEAWTASRFEQARELFATVTLGEDFAEFLTLPGYAMVD